MLWLVFTLADASSSSQLDQDRGTHQPIYGLQTDKAYEVRIRCKMRGYKDFGEYSDTITVRVAEIPSKGTAPGSLSYCAIAIAFRDSYGSVIYVEMHGS